MITENESLFYPNYITVRDRFYLIGDEVLTKMSNCDLKVYKGYITQLSLMSMKLWSRK
jgi:hypothetical protein